MHTDALKLAEHNAADSAPERLSWGAIELQVTDLDRTVAFWTSALGLQVRDRDTHSVAMGTKTKNLFVFHAGASLPVTGSHLGMYHVAIGVPDQKEFSRHLAILNSLNIPASPVDHLMTKSIYFNDPDGLEIEIVYETPERFGRFGDMSQGIVLYDVNGQQHNGRSALDANAELQHATGADLTVPLTQDASIAHMHFKVAHLDTAASWFEAIGFARNLMLPDFGFADMGAGNACTHRLAMNTWTGKDLTPAPDNMARLLHYTLHANDPAVLNNATSLRAAEFGLIGTDPAGIEVSLIPTF